MSGPTVPLAEQIAAVERYEEICVNQCSNDYGWKNEVMPRNEERLTAARAALTTLRDLAEREEPRCAWQQALEALQNSRRSICIPPTPEWLGDGPEPFGATDMAWLGAEGDVGAGRCA